MKRLISVFMALAIIFTSAFAGFPLTEITVQATASYDASAAVTYANAHWNDGKGLCAEYVSDCLKAGGVSEPWSRSCGTLINNLINGGYGTKYMLSCNGSTVSMSNNAGKLSAGDPVFYYCNSCKVYPHVVFCVGSSGDYALANGHNAAMSNQKIWNYFTSGTHAGHTLTMYSIHMNVPVDESALLMYNELSDGTLEVTCDWSKRELLKNVTIPPSYNDKKVTKIRNYGFRDCANLVSVSIPESVTEIGEYAFEECRNLISVSIPNSVETIGVSAFCYCYSLKSINLPNTLKSLGESVFARCSSLQSVNIPYGITRIDGLFYGCWGLMSVKIPETVTEIGDIAFYECENLTSIDIPEGVTYIGDSAFAYCKNLKSVNLPNSLKSLNERVFSYCYSLQSVNIPYGITSIGSDLFRCCESLISVKIPETVTEIGGSAFYGCKNLTSIDIPEGVTSIGSYSIDNSGITDIYYGSSKAQWSKIIIDSPNESLNAATIHYAITEPDVVTGFSGTASEKSIALKWNKSANATSYKLQQQINGSWQTIASPTGTTYTVTGLKANTAYNFRIFARNSAGQSAQTKLTVTTAAGVPAAVTGFMGVANLNSITLNWYKSAGATSYKLQQQINGSWQTIASPTGTTYTVSGLKSNTTYNFRIFARNSGGQSAQTKLTVSTIGAPAAVTGFAGTATANSIVLKWNKSANATEYKLQQQINGGWQTIASPTGTTYTVSGLKANTAYSFRIFARNNSGQSAQTKLTVTTVGAPSAVTGFTGTATANSIVLKWNKNANAAGYKLQQSINGAWQTIASPTGTTYTVSGLKADTAYNFRIFARNSAGQSAQTKLVVTTTGNPAIVTGFMGTANSNSITLNWYESANATEYKLQQMVNGSWQTIAMTSDTTFTVTGLSANTTYNFRIFARNGSLQSDQIKLTVKTK